MFRIPPLFTQDFIGPVMLPKKAEGIDGLKICQSRSRIETVSQTNLIQALIIEDAPKYVCVSVSRTSSIRKYK